MFGAPVTESSFRLAAGTPPDFVIAGAPKCGTTALFRYLCGHPAVFMPRIKDTQFFCPDIKTHSGVRDPAEYRALFADSRGMRGEATCWYLYSEVAAERIMAHNPRAKIIVMLRNPVEAAHSLHAARWSYRHETIAEFEDAWLAQASRLAGQAMPPGWPDAATLQYGAIYRFAPQIRRMQRHVPRQQLHVIVHEEFFADPIRHYAAALEFLGLLPAAPTAFAVVNPAVGPRSSRLEKWLRHPPHFLKKMYAPLRPLVRASGLDPGRAIWNLNSVPRAKPVLAPAFRAELERHFAPDIVELEELLGRSFDIWRR